MKLEDLEKRPSHIGSVVWVCDYRLNDNALLKPMRSVKPTLVQVFSNKDLPSNKRVYYSNCHFNVMKRGKVSSQIIVPFDNTGHRSYTGVSLNIFDTEEECVDCFRDQIIEAKHELKKALKYTTNNILARIKELDELK